MLVLSRREKERLQIGDDIEITVIHIQGNRVKLGIVAPKHVSVRRTELDDKHQPSEPARNPAESPFELTIDGQG